MDEAALFLAGAIFLAVLPITMARFGWSQGGATWGMSWLFLFGCGLARYLSTDYPFVLPLAPTFGTGYAILLIAGSLVFTGRASRFPPRLLMIGLAIVAVRLALMPFVENDQTTMMGSGLISLAALTSSWLLLHPPERSPNASERMLGLVFPVIAIAAIYQATQLPFGPPAAAVAQFWWLLASNSVAFLQVSALFASTREQLGALEAEARLSHDARAELEVEYRQLMDVASDLVGELDEDGRIVYVNPAHEFVLGYEPEEMIGRNADEFFFQDGPIDRKVLTSHSLTMRTFEMTLKGWHRDGGVRTLECKMRPFAASTGERRIVVICRDVTERIAIEKKREENLEELESLVQERTNELRETLEELQRSKRLESMGTLAAGIAHQINNPIGSILMSSELALRSSGQPDELKEGREALQNIVEQAKRCGRIVRSMLQFARNEPTVKAEEDLSTVLRRVCEQADSYGRNQLATTDLSRIEDPLPIWGSAIELEQALLNIVRNAMESSKGPVEVVVAATRSHGSARVTISDNGEGMSDLDVEHVFDPFFTTRLAHGGTGLGLSVAHGVIKDHGGLLSIESKLGVGTTMAISIPLLESEGYG